ncbi:TonB-dependent receptor [Sphingomonas sp. So64.6b]|uniref:TonB-dependent receptor domain-containing protein n=1 Tax=Sphingomonas sp. So64.6b TaxID=2997354 RepID=UPI001603BB12|nr:TonB-dependent receptor [Sphingomonas sp. So64.6b]QNA84011.1 TonB-dependent receptor [Sphingomonas sp. So64.6b]
MKISHLRLAGASCSMMALILAGTASAQTAPVNEAESSEQSSSAQPVAQTLPGETEGRTEEAGDITVTGSRIARPNFDTTEPSVVISSAQIEARGFETLGQALNELPAFGVPGSSPVGGQSSFGPGQSFVNFLGLGSERTLTLVNGRRFVGSNTASIFGPTGQGGNQVDLNVIPTKLIDRVETIVIGGAPIYGSDAIAGTVNVILKRNYEGLELDAQYGISDRGDGANYRFRGLAGKNFLDGRANITLSGEYNKGEGLLQTDRPELYDGGFFGRPNDPDSPFDNVIFRDRRIPTISEFGIPTRFDFIPVSPGQEANLGFPQGGFTDAQGRALRFDATGNLIPIDFGRSFGPLDANGNPLSFDTSASGGNGLSLVPLSNLLTDTKRYSGNILASFDVTDNIRLFGEGWYSRSQGINLRDQPEYNSYLFGYAGDPAGAIVLSTDNPFLTPQARAIIQSQAIGDTFLLQRANTDIVTGRATGSVEIMRFVAGIDGSFKGLGGRDWKFEIVGNYGRSETNGEIPTIATQNFFNAVDAVADANGNIVCRPGYTNSAAQTLSSTCAPLNLFGMQTSQAARDYVTAIARPVSVNKQKIFTASVTGPLFKLPGGDFSFALGYEHRAESQDFNPGSFFSGGPDPDPLTDADGDGDPTNDRVAFGQTVIIQPLFGEYNTDEVFGELRAALISPSNNVPFIHSLELQGAARYVDNSAAGGDLTWTVGASYQPIQDITLRGNYTRAIRAPFITEAFNPSSSFFDFANDPCDQFNRDEGPAPATRAANCTAAGIPANFDATSDDASFLQAVAGNPNLKNEKSKAFTVGAVLRPRFVRGLSVSVDYVDVTVNDVITQLTSDQIVANCYDSADYPSSDFCGRFTRDATNQLDFISTGYFNAAELRYKGILASVDYRTKTPFLGATSNVGVNISYQYLNTLTSRADANSATTHTGGSLGYSRHQAVGSIDYNNEGFSGFVQINYTGPASIALDVTPTFQTPNVVEDVAFINTGMSFRIQKSFSLRFVVDNILDQKPPFPSPTGGGTITYFPGVLGRYFRMGVSVGF